MYSYEGKSCIIQYNPDMSGECYIADKVTGKGIDIQCEDLIDFISSYVRNQKISELEQMSSKEILGIS